MANFIGVTSSNGAQVSDVEAVRRILNDHYIDPGEGEKIEPVWTEPDGRSFVGFWSYGFLSIHPWLEDERLKDQTPDYDADVTEEVLKAIQPYLMEPLVIQSVGYEKLRFPLAAQEIIVPPGEGELEYTDFKNGLAETCDEDVEAVEPPDPDDIDAYKHHRDQEERADEA